MNRRWQAAIVDGRRQPPFSEMRQSLCSSIIFIFLPSVMMMFSEASEESMRMALLVVMFDMLANSSRLR